MFGKEALRVINWMVPGKLFPAIILTSLLLTGCSTYNGPSSSNMVIYNDKPAVTSTASALVRVYENMQWSLPRESSEKHVQAVYFAITQLDDGIKTSWYDTKNNTQGHVRILQTIPKGGSYCRMYESLIQYRERHRTITELACTNDFAKTWTFHTGRNR